MRRLTPTEVAEVIALCVLREKLTQEGVAALYEVSDGCVEKIMKGQRRADVRPVSMTLAAARDRLFGYER